jgi:glycine betaine/proline transport system substrate-binding protein
VTRTMRRAALALGLALVAGACASGGDASGSGDGSLTLVANPWPGSYANAHVAQQLLEQEYGLDVEIAEIDENAQWAGLDGGDFDAVLEIWPSGHAENYATYIEELGTVEDLGELGAVGQIGWFIPTYLLDEYPEMATWEGLVGNEGIFATAETGSSGQFLAADPSFVQFDETIISNLGLDLTVVQSGSEAAQLTAVETAIEAGEPVIFYFYTPHWLHAKYDLTLVELPEYTEGCEEPAEERTCAYPQDVLFKAGAGDLEEREPQAYAFLQRFQMQNEWQDAITFMIDVEGLDASEAAARWIEENEEAWRPWVS